MTKRLDAKRLRIVLYEGEGSTAIEDEQRLSTMTALLEDGHQVTRSGSNGTVATADTSDHLFLGQFDELPTASKAVEGGEIRFADIAGKDSAAIQELVRSQVQEANAEQPGEWKPWFPVIDYSRCTNCMQCLSFCLFGVYGVDDASQIAVDNEDNCKTNCPACSRVCPEAAILFPKYKSGPINGDVVREEDLQRESMKVDISALLGGDIYSALRTRSKDARERFSTERDESKALLERKRCLKKLQKDLDIPDEVLMTLPSAGDIEERARRAREKAEKRKARSRTMQDQKKVTTEEDWGI